VLGGLRTTNLYDNLLRRTNYSVYSPSSTLASTAYTYDAASRLLTVSDGINTASNSGSSEKFVLRVM